MDGLIQSFKSLNRTKKVEQRKIHSLCLTVLGLVHQSAPVSRLRLRLELYHQFPWVCIFLIEDLRTSQPAQSCESTTPSNHSHFICLSICLSIQPSMLMELLFWRIKISTISCSFETLFTYRITVWWLFSADKESIPLARFGQGDHPRATSCCGKARPQVLSWQCLWKSWGAGSVHF